VEPFAGKRLAEKVYGTQHTRSVNGGLGQQSAGHHDEHVVCSLPLPGRGYPPEAGTVLYRGRDFFSFSVKSGKKNGTAHPA
jgi:hypothetical protein